MKQPPCVLLLPPHEMEGSVAALDGAMRGVSHAHHPEGLVAIVPDPGSPTARDSKGVTTLETPEGHKDVRTVAL